MVVKIVVIRAIALAPLVLRLVERARSRFLDPLGSNLNGLFGLSLAMLTGNVPQELVLTIVPIPASDRGVADIRLILHMSSLVVVSIAYSREPLGAELALVRFFPRVNPNVYLEITPLIKLLVANHFLTSFGVSPYHLCADKVLFFFLLRRYFTEILHHGHWHLVLPLLIVLAAKLSETKVGEIVIQLIENKIPVDVRVMVLIMVEAGTWLYEVLLREAGQLRWVGFI